MQFGVPVTGSGILIVSSGILNSGVLSLGNGLSITNNTLTLSGGGSTNIFVGAAEMIPTTTSGCGINSVESTNNLVNYDALEFDAGTAEYAQFVRVLPNNWGTGSLTAKFHWTTTGTSGACVWGIQGQSFSDISLIDNVFGTAQIVEDSLISGNYMHITNATPATTIAGNVANGLPIVFRVFRDPSNTGDNLAVDARLLGTEITYS